MIYSVNDAFEDGVKIGASNNVCSVLIYGVGRTKKCVRNFFRFITFIW